MKHWYDKEYKGIVCEPNSTDEWLELIWQVGFDYDGCNTVESLKGLVDELVEMSQKARDCLHDGMLFEDIYESERSYETALEERWRDMNG